MLINSLYEISNTLLNKDQRGKISPFEFNSIVQQAQRKITNELLSDYKKLILRKNRYNLGSGFADEAKYNIQAIEYYLDIKKTENASDSYTLPNTVWFVNDVYNDLSLVEKVDNSPFNTLKRSGRMKPSQCMPVCTIIGNTLRFFPKQRRIEIHCLRKPLEPKWTYKIIDDIPLFNQSSQDFQDIDVHYSLITDLLIEVVGMCGLNLREQEIEQYIAQMKQESIAKQN